MTLVALSAAYGADGSRIAPALAERLGVPFLDRAIPLAVAERLDLEPDDADEHEEGDPPSLLARLLRGFIGTDTGVPTPAPPELLTDEDFRTATEAVLLEQAASGQGVILGRGAPFVLREDPRVLRVRLVGPAERRLAQAMRLQGIDEVTAQRGMRRIDRAHADYIRRFYGVDIDDPTQYHLILDSTALDAGACVDLIARAAFALGAAAGHHDEVA